MLKAQANMRECDTDNTSCLLNEQSSPGVNIAFLDLPQLQGCWLVYLLGCKNDKDNPVGK